MAKVDEQLVKQYVNPTGYATVQHELGAIALMETATRTAYYLQGA